MKATALRQELRVGRLTRSFLLVDGTPSTRTPRAVLFVLHGSPQDAQSMRRFSRHSFDQLAVNGNVAVVYPDGLKKSWNHNRPSASATDDVAFMSALSDEFRSRYGPVPMIATGFSNGGQLVIRLIHEIPEQFQGAAIVGATLPRPGRMAFDDKHKPLPVMLVHGTRDWVVPYRGEGWFGSLFGKKRGPSAPETAQYFAKRNNITAEPAQRRLPHRRESGRTSVTLTLYEQEGRDSVALFTVSGGGHVVPNRRRRAIFLAGRTTQDISVAEELCSFFPVLQP